MAVVIIVTNLTVCLTVCVYVVHHVSFMSYFLTH